jgi:hypothetical protein
MAAPSTALARTSTDALVAALGHLHDSIAQVVLAAGTTGMIPHAETPLGLDYVRAASAIAELLDARLACS